MSTFVQLEPLSDFVSARPPQVSRKTKTTEEPARRGRILPQKLGRYTLFAHIGRGGMADIYLASAATDFGGARLVVIKEVLPELASDAHFADMLVSEAKLAAGLNHANIVKVEDLGREKALYIAMEYVEGIDLREMLRRCAKQRVPVPVEFSLRIVMDALKGLSFAHRFRGEDGFRMAIVHRDVSPSNVLLSFEGEVKLCDFGIARANILCESLAESAIQGKAGYMSPEQARGDALDVSADVFAAGIILWELVAGRRLYKAKEDERLLDVARRAEIPALPKRDLPFEEELHAIVAKALAKDANDRYRTAGAMLSDLEDYTLKARLVASPLRLGDWLTEHFSSDVIEPRRARQRAIRALALGPAATLVPLHEEATPSTFAVVERAESIEEPGARAAEREDAHTEAGSANDVRPPPEAEPARFGWMALAAAALAVAAGTFWRIAFGH